MHTINTLAPEVKQETLKSPDYDFVMDELAEAYTPVNTTEAQPLPETARNLVTAERQALINRQNLLKRRPQTTEVQAALNKLQPEYHAANHAITVLSKTDTPSKTEAREVRDVFIHLANRASRHAAQVQVEAVSSNELRDDEQFFEKVNEKRRLRKEWADLDALIKNTPNVPSHNFTSIYTALRSKYKTLQDEINNTDRGRLIQQYAIQQRALAQYSPHVRMYTALAQEN